MPHRYMISLVVFALVAAVPPASAAPNVHEGLWEYEIKTEMPGAPMQIPPQKSTQCVTGKDLVPKPPPAQPGSECKNTRSQVSGDTATWSVQCQQRAVTVQSTGSVTYKGDSMRGTIRTTMNMGGGQTHTSVSTISGKRVGPCK